MPRIAQALLLLAATSWQPVAAQPPAGPPARPSIPPRDSYPDCALSFQTASGLRGKLATLRHCRRSVSLYRQTYLQAFKTRIANHADHLERYRAAIQGAAMAEPERQALLGQYETEKGQLEPGGDLYEAERALAARADTDIEFIGEEICRLLQRSGNSCQ